MLESADEARIHHLFEVEGRSVSSVDLSDLPAGSLVRLHTVSGNRYLVEVTEDVGGSILPLSSGYLIQRNYRDLVGHLDPKEPVALATRAEVGLRFMWLVQDGRRAFTSSLEEIVVLDSQK